MTLKNGTKVTTTEVWQNKLRPELIEDLEREVYGRLPKNIPSVKWTVKITDKEFVGRLPVVVKQVIGHVDNLEYPLINVDINIMVVVPSNIKSPVPVLIMFGRPSFPSPAQPSPEHMEKINNAFKDMMIKNDPSLKAIFDQYPAYQPITRLPFFAPPPADDLPTAKQLLPLVGDT